MSRDLSKRMRASLFSQETGDVAMALLTVAHEDLDEDLRLCTNPVERLQDDPPLYGVVSRGKRYLFAPIEVILPQDVADGDPRASLSIDNIDLSLVDMLQAMETGATISLELVLASDPDTVEMAFPTLSMVSAEYDRETVVIDLTLDPLVTEPYPGDSFTPANFPGLM